MQTIIKNLKYLPLLALVVYIILNQVGCVGRKIIKEVIVTKIEYLVHHDSFMAEILVPVEKKVIVKVKGDLDSLEQVYTNRINDLQRSVVEYENAIFDLKHETPPEEIVITANEYKDSFDTDTYSLKVAIGVVGHLESFNYSLEQFEKKLTCPDCPKVRNNFISLGMEVGFDGENEAKVGYGHKFMYGKAGYKIRDQFDIKNFTGELGFLFRF